MAYIENMLFAVRPDQFEMILDALEYLKWRLEKERPKLGEYRDQSCHMKAGRYVERRIDELVESLLAQSKQQGTPREPT